MPQLNPALTTWNDICNAALVDCNAVGTGQTASGNDLEDALARLQWLLQQWEQKRWLVYHLVTAGVVCNGNQIYTIGPGGHFDTNQPASPWDPRFGGGGSGTQGIGGATGGQPVTENPFGPSYPISVRPDKIESSFLRQLTQSQPNQIDYPMKIITSWEDYNRIALKQLATFPGYVFYDPAWPLGNLFPWPVPNPSIYALFVTYKEQLPPMAYSPATKFNIPFVYYRAMVKNLALELRPKYGINTYPGDQLPGQAKDSLRAIRGGAVQIANLQMPGDLVRPQLYNIFSDRNY